ncbi:MAG: aldo/keto reductase [Bacteroidales bacterium]|nr:aldo/keto reductase [Bacteroidales bacterium]MBR1434974.1 aldo/keto reductase [Bacteroidales bacterium]
MKTLRTIIALGASAIILSGNAVAQNVPTVTLNNGAVMPLFGIGTYNQTNEQAYEGVKYALQHGYRHIDTAHAYGDEEGVGRAIKDSGVPREEIWVTSKLWMNDYGDGKTLEHIDEMLQRLGLEYLDLLYIHQPFGDLEACWKDMEKAVELGKVRTLGISNFDRDPSLIDKFATEMKIKPAILQLESHPYRQALDIKAQCEKYGIILEDWFPLGGQMSQGALFEDPVIKEIAAAHGKTPVQVILRWHIQDGRSAIPGSKTPSHIDENIDIFDFELTAADMQKLRSINKEDPFFKMPGQAVRQMSERNNVVPNFSR